VVSRAATAGENEAVRWESDGSGTFTSELTTRASRGTDVILHLRDEDKNFLDPWTLRETITKYSDHISTPVYLLEEKPAEEGKTPEKDWVQ
ncbi:molecular chaperone HtpG, partial [Xanthomonas citri pv. citri]|nr:molecular chaperone HtpG [Xanthomonas citri pv. citri]